MRLAFAAALAGFGAALALASPAVEASRFAADSGIPSAAPAPQEPNWIRASTMEREPFAARIFVRLLFADPQMRDFAILEPAQRPARLVPYAAAWRVDTALGAIADPVAAAWDARHDIVRQIIAAERAQCRGDFRTMLRSEVLAEDTPMLHIATSCDGSAEPGAHARVVLLPIGAREIVAISHWSADDRAGARAEARLVQTIRDAIAQSHARAHPR